MQAKTAQGHIRTFRPCLVPREYQNAPSFSLSSRAKRISSRLSLRLRNSSEMVSSIIVDYLRNTYFYFSK